MGIQGDPIVEAEESTLLVVNIENIFAGTLGPREAGICLAWGSTPGLWRRTRRGSMKKTGNILRVSVGGELVCAKRSGILA
jgi:hypothetical protein